MASGFLRPLPADRPPLRTARLRPAQRFEQMLLQFHRQGRPPRTWILANETRQGVDPLGPDACLVFALSPLVGSPLTTSAKFAVVAIGPLTGRVCDALCSSHFAIAAKRTGVERSVGSRRGDFRR